MQTLTDVTVYKILRHTIPRFRPYRSGKTWIIYNMIIFPTNLSRKNQALRQVLSAAHH